MEQTVHFRLFYLLIYPLAVTAYSARTELGISNIMLRDGASFELGLPLKLTQMDCQVLCTLRELRGVFILGRSVMSLMRCHLFRVMCSINVVNVTVLLVSCPVMSFFTFRCNVD